MKNDMRREMREVRVSSWKDTKHKIVSIAKITERFLIDFVAEADADGHDVLHHGYFRRIELAMSNPDRSRRC